MMTLRSGLIDYNFSETRNGQKQYGRTVDIVWTAKKIQPCKFERWFEIGKGASRIRVGCGQCQGCGNKCPTIPLAIVTLAQYLESTISNMGPVIVKITLRIISRSSRW